jgi:hypothetical protein
LTRSGFRIAPALIFVTILSGSLFVAPPALADPATDLTDALASARSETSCAPFQYDPVLEQGAKVYNEMAYKYLNHTATRVPTAKEPPGAPVDPMPGLKDLGFTGSKAYLLQGANESQGIAIKGAILEGRAYEVIDDCTYTGFGVDMRNSPDTGYNLTAIILAGP